MSDHNLGNSRIKLKFSVSDDFTVNTDAFLYLKYNLPTGQLQVNVNKMFIVALLMFGVTLLFLTLHTPRSLKQRSPLLHNRKILSKAGD